MVKGIEEWLVRNRRVCSNINNRGNSIDIIFDNYARLTINSDLVAYVFIPMPTIEDSIVSNDSSKTLHPLEIPFVDKYRYVRSQQINIIDPRGDREYYLGKKGFKTNRR